MKTYIILGVSLSLLLLFTSCTCMTENTTAMNNQSLVGKLAPSIAYTDDSGQSHMLSRSYGDATVIAIVDQHSADSNSDVIRMTNNLPSDIPIIEISLSDNNRSAKEMATLIKNQYTQGRNVISLSDNKGLINSKFRNAKANSVFLLDHKGIIRRQGNLSQVDSFVKNIRNIRDDIEKENEALYTGG